MKVRKISLKLKQRREAWNKLEKFGVGPDRILAMLDADDATMQRLAAAWPVFSPPYVYDAVSILGFGGASEESLPEARIGEIVIRYGGWSFRELRDSTMGKKFLEQQHGYDEYPWSGVKLPAGNYSLRIPVAASNCKNLREQMRWLSSNERVAPAVLVATALLSHYVRTGQDLLRNEYTRCKESRLPCSHIVLGWEKGRLSVGSGECFADNERFSNVWLSSVQTS